MDMIVTGSLEFFSSENCKDKDFIVFQEQEEIFCYVRNESEKACYFSYKAGMSKAKYFEWLCHKNNQPLNTAALITQGFLDALSIDIFGEDYEVVFSQIKKSFVLCHAQFDYVTERFSKYIYRYYIYMCFIRAQSFELKKNNLAIALELKNGIYRKDVLLNMFDFFGIAHLFDDRTKGIVFKEE